MNKAKSGFFCNNCGYESAKWAGKCPSCLQWNTFIEELVIKPSNKKLSSQQFAIDASENKALKLEEIESGKEQRIQTPDGEINRVLGGGIVLGSLILVAGEPGIGKSTLFLQLGLQLKQQKVLYVSGEESLQQIKLRAERLKISNSNFYLLAETNTQNIFSEIKKAKPDLIIIDSIQTLESPYLDSAAGSVSQLKECTAEFQRFAKQMGIPVILIGHITKDGSIAGPKMLEHMVDVVLQFEGDRQHIFRILRTLKNRFGSTNELGIYEMGDKGMVEVSNPSELFIGQLQLMLSGSAVAATLEGMRPLFIEVQALVAQSVYSTPQRTVTGFDLRRLQLLLAVLEKRGGLSFAHKDVFVNIAGGLRPEDPALDLAVAVALLSSFEDREVPASICFAGEIGLKGEIRAISRIDQRIAEASRLGFEKIFISGLHQSVIAHQKIEIIPVSTLDALYTRLF